MTCPVCNGKSGVYASTKSDDNIVRYRKCTVCGYNFASIEVDADLFDRKNKEIDRLHGR